MPKITKVNNPAKRDEIATGFLGGLNTFQDENVLRDSELTEAKNIILSVDGISPRPGTTAYGSSSGTSMLGGIGYYKSDGTRQFLRYAGGANNKLQKYVSGTPTDIGSKTFNASAQMNFVQAGDLVDKLFICNGVDGLSIYDGTSITSYSTLITPVGLTVTPNGTTGSTRYSYRVSACNDIGETLACTSVVITNGNATLSVTNYNALAWTATAGATKYNIYGRIDTGLTETYMATTYTNSYNDQGQDDPTLTVFPQDANTTTGPVGTMVVFAISRVFISGDPNYPSRVYFSGKGEHINDFSGSDIGGGSFDVFAADGAKIRAILPFQGGVIIWKDNAIYKFSFNTATGFQQLEEITRSFGGISFRSCKHVENDVIFAARKDGRLAFYSLGNQENYASAVLRTNELSIKVAEELKDVNMAYITNAASFYFNNIYGCAIPKTDSTTNNRVWCLDTRFGAWTYWEGISPDFFTDYVDTDGTQKLYYGDESSGYIKEMFTTARNDSGSTISVAFSTKAFNQKSFNKYKTYYNPTFQFKDVTTSGALSGDVIVDGAVVTSSFSVRQQTTGGAGVGSDYVGSFLIGDTQNGTVTANLSSDIIVQLQSLHRARSIKYAFRSNTINANYKFLSLAHTVATNADKPLDQDTHSYPT